MKKLFTQMLTVGLVVVMVCVNIFAQNETPVKFPKGKSKTTMTGNLAKGQEKYFTFNAKEGQNVTVTVVAGNKKVTVNGFGTGGDESINPSVDGLTDDGKNTFSIANMGKTATTYTMTVTIH